MNTQKLNALFNSLTIKIEKENWPVHGIEVYKDNQLLQSWGNTTAKFPIYSITKSLVSLAAGIAEAEGLITLNDCILKYIPEDYLAKISADQKSLFENITIERLLTMSIKGFEFRPEGDDWLLYSLISPIKPDKIEFHYTNICAYLVGVALTTATGEPLFQYINRKIFQPLGIDTPEYGVSPEGYMNAASGIMLNVKELAKIGQLIIDKGMYNGKQIVPSDYIKRATDVQIMNKESGYGYFIWKWCDGFSLNGKWGQKCYCIPGENILISVLSDFQESAAALKSEITSWFSL